MLHHEMWRDELEPWLIASSSNTLFDFFHNMKMSSNPYVWYLILHFVSKISLNPAIVQVSHLVFAVGAIYLFLRFSPFTLFQKLLFCSGYYALYEYGIISRGYALTIFFIFLFCSLYSRYFKSSIPLAIVIFFLANATGGFGVILSISLLIFITANYFFNKMQDSENKLSIKHTGWSVIIILFSIWVSMKSIVPPPDSAFAAHWITYINPDRFLNVLWWMWYGFVPIPQLSGIQFWNTNIIAVGDGCYFAKTFLTFFSFFLLGYNCLLFVRKPSVLLFYLSGTFGILLFSYMNPSIYYINASRYHGFLYLIFIVSLWLSASFSEKKNIVIPFLTLWSEKLNVHKFKNYVLMFFLIVNVFAGLIAYGKDLRYTFSAVEETGKYIVSNDLQKYITTGFIDYTVAPITAYTRCPVYYPDRDTISTFPIWRMKNYTADMSQGTDRMLKFIAQKNDTVLVILNFDLDTSGINNIRFHSLARFEESIVAGESFSVYLASKQNLIK